MMMDMKQLAKAKAETGRRGFIAGVAAAAVGAAAGASAGGGAGEASGRPFKVCVFTDIHFDDFWPNSDDTSFLDGIMARAEREKCDMMVHLGDFMHGVEKPRQKMFVEKYNASRIPAYHVLGNHDQDQCDDRATLEAYRMRGSGYYSFDMGGFRFVVADANYFRCEPGKFVHYGKAGCPRIGGRIGYWVPPEQLEWLRSAIVGSPLPCVVMAHESFERANYLPVQNAAEVRRIFAEANAKKPGTVRLVMNGHNHNDNLRILDGIPYWDVNSANYQWFGKKHAKYPAEYVKRHPGSVYTLGWTKPLSAVLSLWPDGRVKIEGSEAEWLFGVAAKDAGFPVCDGDGRETHPKILSADFRMIF